MNRLSFILILLTLGSGALAAQKKATHPLMASETVTWAGLDYSMTRMIGPNDFNNPPAIFPGYLESWNNLFLAERIRRVESALKKKVTVDIGGVTEKNKTAQPSQVTQTPGPDDAVEKSHITAKDIAEAVQSYKMQNSSGLGLVFIVDRLSKPEVRGAVYVVFFDVGSREVISTERFVEPPAGVGFRNYWFGVIKKVDAQLKKYR
jgi:hypothetical protein